MHESLKRIIVVHCLRYGIQNTPKKYSETKIYDYTIIDAINSTKNITF